MYFRGTDDKVWRVKTDGTDASNPKGFKTQSDVFGAADGYMYFRGTDDKVWRVKTDGIKGKYDVVYVGTENNTIYAIDISTGNVLLSANFGAPVPISALPGNCNNNANHIGINSTPVIDASTRTMYVITYTFESQLTTLRNPVFRIHALDLEDLSDKVPPVVITASQNLSDGTTYKFRPHNARQRSALLEANGNIYAGFASFCDYEANNSRGWLLGWRTGSLRSLAGNELTDKQTDAQTPNGDFKSYFLSSIWMSGYGVAADSSGDLYFVTGNSDKIRLNNIQESAVRIAPDLAAIKDFFTPANFADLDQGDLDFGAGGLMVLPDQPAPLPHRAVAAGKDGRLFILNRDDMGGFVSGGPDKPKYVDIGSCWCGPSYFVGYDRVARVVSSGGTQVKTWKVDTSAAVALVNEGTSASLNGGQDAGFFTMISSNGTNENTAIIWAVSRPVGGDASNPGGFKTQSDVLVAADGYMYFRGTDDKVWRVKTDGIKGKYDVVYVGTENNTIYAIDISTGNVLLSANFGAPVPISALPGNCNNNANHIGINSTPVIDASTRTMYVITYTFESQLTTLRNPVFRIHALDLEDLSDKVPPVVITASQNLSDGTTYKFRPHNARQRSALLEANGNIYAGFASFCDYEANNSRGWLLGWRTGSLRSLAGNELTDKQTDAQTPNGDFKSYFLSSIWMSGYGVAADSSGDLYFVTGNSDKIRLNNIQESAVRIAPDLAAIKDFFTPANFADLDQGDLDFGAGALMVLPDQPAPLPHLAVAAGKDGRLFILNRDDMGRFVSGGPDKPKYLNNCSCRCDPLSVFHYECLH